MRWITAFTLMVAMTAGVKAADPCSEFFTLEQLWTLQKAYDHGESKGLGYTMAAIVWKESSAGLYLSRKDGEHWAMNSYGPFHILLKTAKKRRGCSTWNCSRVKRKLMNDFQYSADLAVEELEYWSQRLGSYRKAFAAYNAGNAWSGRAGSAYSKDIRHKIRYLQQCVRF